MQASEFNWKNILYCLIITLLLSANYCNAEIRVLPVPPKTYLNISTSVLSGRVDSAEAGCKKSVEIQSAIRAATGGSVYSIGYVGVEWVQDTWNCISSNNFMGQVVNTYQDGSGYTVYECSYGFLSRLNNGPWQCFENFYETSVAILTLTPAPNQTDPRPAGTETKDAKSTYELIAKVTEGSTPKMGVAVSFGVEVVAGTGGHETGHTGVRPPGTLSKTRGTTDANGEVKLTFNAEEVAGIHKVTATCSDCTNKTSVKEVQVKVPDLSPISPNTPKNKKGAYRYSLTSADPEHQGQGRYFSGQYWLTETANNNLQELIDQFEEEGWGTVALNDASLFWGGLYDIALPDKGIPSHWTTPHVEHRLGEEIDISFTRAGNPISTAKQNEFYKKFCEDKKSQIPFSILHHYLKGPHFHVRLVAANRCGKTAK